MKDKIKEISGYVLIILLILCVRTFVITPIKVNGQSMNDTLHDGDYMVLKKYDKEIERFDIVVVKRGKDRLIKRVIGLPKEDIEYRENELYVDGEQVDDDFGKGETYDFADYCAKDEYFVLGDNREDSTDSRIIGCVPREDILGKTDFVLFPFSKWGNVK